MAFPPPVLPVQLPLGLTDGEALATTENAPGVVGTVSANVHVVLAVPDVCVGFSLVQSGLRLTHFVSSEVVTVNVAFPPLP